MAEGNVHDVIRGYLARLKEVGVEASEAIVYGPCARHGDCDTDIDVVVVAPSFGDDAFADGRILLKTAWETDPRIRPTPASTDAWQDADNDPRLFLAKAEGISVKPG